MKVYSSFEYSSLILPCHEWFIQGFKSGSLYFLLLILPCVFLFAKNANQYVMTYYGLTTSFNSGPFVGNGFGVTYTGYLWGEAENAGASGGASVPISRVRTYEPRRYRPNQQSHGSAHGNGDSDFHTIGLQGRFDYASTSIDDGYRYSQLLYTYSFGFGASFRQKLLESLFVYENCGIEAGNVFSGVYADFGLVYDWIVSFSFGCKASIGYLYDNERLGLDYPLVAPYISIGYSF